jgi:hypothetical protein
MVRRAVRPCIATLALALATAPRSTRAGEPAADGTPTADAGAPARASVAPPLQLYYLQYGISMVAELVASPGPICANEAEACILGSGGGVAGHVGGRIPSGWYFGGSYEFSKHDPENLFRLAVLQQFRAEVRRYLVTGKRVEPYVVLAAGFGGYGNAWAIDTWGPLGSLGLGAEAQLSRTRVLGIQVGYRFIYFQAFADSSGTQRDAGFAQLVGFDLFLQARDPL